MIELGVLVGLLAIAGRYVVVIRKLRKSYRDLMAVVKSVELARADGVINEEEAKAIIEKVYRLAGDIRELKGVLK